MPRWRRDELLYIAAPLGPSDGRMMAVSVTTSGPTFEFGAAVALFRTQMMPGYTIGRDCDVTPDGQRFLVGTANGEAKKAPVTIILNGMAAIPGHQ